MSEGSHLLIWRPAASDLGIVVEGPVRVDLGNGRTVDADMLVHDFGHARGAIVVADARKLAGLEDAILEAGFACSIMDMPRPGATYDRDTIISVLSDWGWTGPENRRPDWFQSSESDAE